MAFPSIRRQVPQMPLHFRKFWNLQSSGSGFKVVVSQNTFGIADMSEHQFVNIYDDFESQPRLIMEQVTEHSELSVSSRPLASELELFPLPQSVRYPLSALPLLPPSLALLSRGGDGGRKKKRWQKANLLRPSLTHITGKLSVPFLKFWQVFHTYTSRGIAKIEGS